MILWFLFLLIQHLKTISYNSDSAVLSHAQRRHLRIVHCSWKNVFWYQQSMKRAVGVHYTDQWISTKYDYDNIFGSYFFFSGLYGIMVWMCDQNSVESTQVMQVDQSLHVIKTSSVSLAAPAVAEGMYHSFTLSSAIKLE